MAESLKGATTAPAPPFLFNTSISMRKFFLLFALLAAGTAWSASAAAQSQPAPLQTPQQTAATGAISVCGTQVGAPANLPPAGSGPVIYYIGLCFPKQENKSVIDGQTYLYYIQTRPSRPRSNEWVPYDDKAEKMLVEDFKRLWGTNFLDDLSIDVLDYQFSNGVVGKVIVYDMQERERVKLVDYEGNKHVEVTKIDEKLKEENVSIRLDSFLDQSTIQKVRVILANMLAEKGYEYATINPVVTPIPGGNRTVHLTFKVDEGPKVKIRKVTFTGNKAFSAKKLRKQMKDNKQKDLLSFITSHGTFQRAKYEDDADKLTEFYRNNGYIGVRVGEPDVKIIEDAKDRTTRWVELRVPILEGDRYRVNTLTFDGIKIMKPDFVRALFKVKPGDWYNEKEIRKGLDKVREAYGTVGYWEFTGYPDLKPEGGDQAQPGENPDGSGEQAAAATKPADGDQAKATAAQDAKPATQEKPARGKLALANAAPKVDVVMRMQEGKQYFVNRITFQGNTTTRDNVVRREMRLVEGGVFNTEALKFSVKRINQLGYFKNLEGGKDLDVQKTPGADNKVDVTLKVEEQNRNQITFGAGVSQFEGVFGQLGFQTANFMGKGEQFNISLQAGSRAQMYQIGFTEPFLFERNFSAGINLYKQRLDYLYQFTQNSIGGDITLGVPVGGFGRGFLNYSYQVSKVYNINALFTNPIFLAQNPYYAETLLAATNGSRTVSKITPSYVYNTIDSPIFPTTGRRYTASVDIAGLGGNTAFYKPSLEGVWYLQQNKRISFAFRGQLQYLAPLGDQTIQPGTTGCEFSTQPCLTLPIFERLAMGGEYSVRGFDLRSIGPKYQGTDLVIGGNKSLLFNAEYLISIAGPVRLVLFADAGQVRDFGHGFAMNQFKTSTGAEIRFFMPVLNVPFRLIMAFNPNRSGVLDNTYQPQKAFSFRFAVGSTF